MVASRDDDLLHAVYAGGGRETIAALYDRWAETYDDDMGVAGYRHPPVASGLFARHVPRGAGPTLDAGCGTGLMGQILALLGYEEIEGLDISDGMLGRAASKGVYAALHRAALGERLPFEDGRFAAVISTGVFTEGHVGAEALPELLRVTRAGAIFVLTVRVSVWEMGLGAALGELVETGSLASVEATPVYAAMPRESGGVPARAHVFRRL